MFKFLTDLVQPLRLRCPLNKTTTSFSFGCLSKEVCHAYLLTLTVSNWDPLLMSEHVDATGASALKCARFTTFMIFVDLYSTSKWVILPFTKDTGMHIKDFQFLLTFWTISFPVSSITVHFNGICIIFHSILGGYKPR